MSPDQHRDLSRRERQIMDALYRLGEGSVRDVLGRMPRDASYGTVRVTLGVLAEKGYVRFRSEGRRYVYTPVVAADAAKRSALGHLMKTFFAGSPGQAVLALLEMSSEDLSERDLEEIRSWIEQVREDEEG